MQILDGVGITRHPHRQVDIEGIDRLIAEGRVWPDHDVQLQSVSKLEPQAGVFEIRAINRAKSEDIAVKGPGTLEVESRDQQMVQGRAIHESHSRIKTLH